jgi:hypothetical protein
MKVALCISGLSRTYKESYSTLSEFIINKVKPDIFISTWSDSNNSEFYKLYNPLAFESEVYHETNFNCFANYNHYVQKFNFFPKNLLPMYYKIYKANLLKLAHENFTKEKYDIVIRTRSDLLYKNEIDIKEIDECLKNKKTIFCRKDTEHDPTYSNIDWCWDQFAFGSSFAMDIYSDTVNKLDGCLYTILEKFNKGQLKHHSPLTPEFMFRENMYNNDINITQSNIRYDFIRK